MKPEWKETFIGDGNYTQLIMGQSPAGESYNKDKKGLPFYQGKADFGDFHPTPTVWCDKPKRIALPNDILLSVRAPVGPTNVANEECCIGRGLAIIRCLGEVDYRYLLLVLRYFEGEISEKGRGGTFESIGKDDVKKIKFRFPVKTEDQISFAKELQSQLTRVETMRQEALKQKEAAKALQSAILREVFPWQAGESLPSGWRWEKITGISKNLDGKRIPVTEKVRKKGNIPYYGASGIVDYVQDYLFDEDLLLVSEDGGNLVMRTYPIAFSISGKTWVNNHAHVLKFENKDTQKIVEYYINRLDISDYVSGAAQPKLNQENLNRIKIPVPIDANTKSKVVKKIEQTFEVNNKITKQADMQLNAIEVLPAAVLREAFNFKINEN